MNRRTLTAAGGATLLVGGGAAVAVRAANADAELFNKSEQVDALDIAYKRALDLYGRCEAEYWRDRNVAAAHWRYVEADKAQSEACERLSEAQAELAAMPAVLLAGLRCKARHAERDPYDDDLLESIVRDILAMGGTS